MSKYPWNKSKDNEPDKQMEDVYAGPPFEEMMMCTYAGPEFYNGGNAAGMGVFVPPEQMPYFCKTCGNPLKKEYKFCPSCGAPIPAEDE